MLFAFRLWQTTGCRHFLGHYFNPIYIKINVEAQVGIDKNISKLESKFFHNKLTALVFEPPKSYLAAFEPSYLLEVLSPLGVALFLLSIKKGIGTKNKIIGLHFLLVLIAAFVYITPVSPKNSFFIFSALVYSFSLWHVDYFAAKKYRILIFLLLLIFSYVFFAYTWQMKSICNEIKFS